MIDWDDVRYFLAAARGGSVRAAAERLGVNHDAEAQIVAVRQGLGITTLPCFVGDADPLLVRVPGTDLHMYGTLWLLTQGESRKTKRVRLFTEFLSRRLAAYAPLLAGLSILRD
jgi:DNA-binding transcriptional LysR family regulator